jgi:hypothetical protein
MQSQTNEISEANNIPEASPMIPELKMMKIPEHHPLKCLKDSEHISAD